MKHLILVSEVWQHDFLSPSALLLSQGSFKCSLIFCFYKMHSHIKKSKTSKQGRIARHLGHPET